MPDRRRTSVKREQQANFVLWEPDVLRPSEKISSVGGILFRAEGNIVLAAHARLFGAA